MLATIVCKCCVHKSRYVSGSLIPAKNAYVGLSVATTAGSWQLESKVITNQTLLNMYRLIFHSVINLDI